MHFKLNQKLIKWLVFAVILIFALGIRINIQSKKNSYFGDEYLSYMITTKNPLWPQNVPDSTKMHSNDLYMQYLKVDPSFQSMIDQVVRLRKSTGDPPHPNLYYSLLRVSLWGVDNTSSYDILQRGFYLNLFLFLLSFFLFYRFVNYLFRNDILVFCALGIAFLNPAAVANTIFIRPYQMQELIFILFTYVTIRYYCKIKNRITFNRWKFIFIYGLIIALTLLTGYFSVGYVLILLILFSFFILRKDNKKTFYFLFAAITISIVFVLLIYPKYFRGFSSDRGTEAFSKFSLIFIFENVNELFHSLRVYYCDYLILILLVILVAIIPNKRMLLNDSNDKNQNKYVIPIIFICCFLWITVIFHLAPFKSIRYILPILPIMSLIIPFLLSFVKYKYQIIFSCLLIIYLSYKTSTCKEIYVKLQPINKTYLEEKYLPIISMDLEGWLKNSTIPFYENGDRTVEFLSDSIDFVNKVNQYDELFVLLSQWSIYNDRIPDNYNIVIKDSETEYVTLYKLKRKNTIRR